MIQFPIIPKDAARLQAQSKPQPVGGGQLQAGSHTLYDTNMYPAAGTAILPFFTVARANLFLSNLDTPGVLQSGQYLEIYAFTLDILAPAGIATVQVDEAVILMGAGVAGVGCPIFTFHYNNKVYGPWPLRQFHGLGGITGFSTGIADNYANNSLPDGGVWQGGPEMDFHGITLAPQKGFRVVLEWPLPLAPVGQDYDLQVGIVGVLHREVV